MRYLIASVTLGVLFAYLTYTRWWKRLLFVLFSIFVPIIANGFRAYMIVMIGHLSDMKYAVGVDHLIYGWVFFGVIITIMFVVGSIWRDPMAPTPAFAGQPTTSISVRDSSRLLGLLAVSTLFWPLSAWALSDHGHHVASVSIDPPTGSSWRVSGDIDAWDWRPRVLGADGSLYSYYVSDGHSEQSPVGLYLGVYRTQRPGAELVTSANVMIEQEHPVWSDTLVRPRSVDLASGEIGLEQHLLSSRRGERLLVWSWYLVGDRHTANPYLAKLLEAKSRLTGKRGEAALIAVATPYEEKIEPAAARLTGFLNDLLPGIEAEVDRSLGAPE
jgi:EpsI family protein